MLVVQPCPRCLRPTVLVDVHSVRWPAHPITQFSYPPHSYSSDGNSADQPRNWRFSV
jgi:hypothetical protein